MPHVWKLQRQDGHKTILSSRRAKPYNKMLIPKQTQGIRNHENYFVNKVSSGFFSQKFRELSK